MTELEILKKKIISLDFLSIKRLLDLYKKNPKFVVPEGRMGRLELLLNGGLEDFSISRLASKMPWVFQFQEMTGRVVYVWFDALVNYISVVGWPTDMEQFQKWWVTSVELFNIAVKTISVSSLQCGRQCFMSAGLTPSQTIVMMDLSQVGGKKCQKVKECNKSSCGC